MLEFEAPYLPFESLFKKVCIRYGNLQYTKFTSQPCHLIKFYICAEFLDTKLLVFMLPKAS